MYTTKSLKGKLLGRNLAVKVLSIEYLKKKLKDIAEAPSIGYKGHF